MDILIILAIGLGVWLLFFGGKTKHPDSPKLIEMRQYIGQHKRPFRILEWLLTPVDPRIVKSYIFYMCFCIGLPIFGLLFLGLPIFVEYILLSVLIIDLLNYNNQLLLEVTLWNPEFREKFMKR